MAERPRRASFMGFNQGGDSQAKTSQPARCHAPFSTVGKEDATIHGKQQETSSKGKVIHRSPQSFHLPPPTGNSCNKTFLPSLFVWWFGLFFFCLGQRVILKKTQPSGKSMLGTPGVTGSNREAGSLGATFSSPAQAWQSSRGGEAATRAALRCAGRTKRAEVTDGHCSLIYISSYKFPVAFLFHEKKQITPLR